MARKTKREIARETIRALDGKPSVDTLIRNYRELFFEYKKLQKEHEKIVALRDKLYSKLCKKGNELSYTRDQMIKHLDPTKDEVEEELKKVA